MNENFNIHNYKHIHMIGIGGVSMSGIAEILAHFGFKVTGSDRTDSEIVQKLVEKGIPVQIGHDLINSKKANLVVYTAAVKADDPELVQARKFNVPTMERADFLGQITKLYKDTICVSGTHGKTTTTSMVSLCFLEAGLNPTIQVGAILKEIDGNNHIGSKDYFIIEACEYVESFLKFYPKSEIILNIDNDHLDYFKTFDNVKNAFVKYVKLIPEDGLLVINGDDKNCLALADFTKSKFVTYGIENKQVDFYAKNMVSDEDGFYQFDVYHNGEFYERFKLSIPGIHNVSNALACIALCDSYGISKEAMQKALLSFTGANRRFDYVGSYKDIKVYDDYAHHPTEIQSVYNSVKNKKHHENWIIFQSHTYSRTKNLLDEFAEVLANFDHVIITDIYAAREINQYGVSPEDLIAKIATHGKTAKYISKFEDIANYIRENAQANDIVLTVGAGTITQLGKFIVE